MNACNKVQLDLIFAKVFFREKIMSTNQRHGGFPWFPWPFFRPPRGEAPAWPLIVVWYIFNHIHPTCPLSNWLGRWISSSIRGTCDHSLVDLPVNHQWLYHSFFFCQLFFEINKFVQFSYTFSLADDFFYSLQKITWTENLNINLNQLNPGTSSKL